MRQKLTLLALLGVFLSPVPASAQQTGTISGKVTATDGAVLPGVTIEVRSTVLPGPRTAVTGATGEYRLPALPPGDYSVKFTLSGMQTLTRQAQVQLLQDTVVDAQLSVQGVTEAVTVTASTTLIDRDTATIKSGLSNEQIRALPVGQEYRDIVKLIPSVQYTQDTTRGPERGRQRPGQPLSVRRRQRDAAALRHALGRAGGARHRAGDDDQGRRAGGGLRPLRRLLDRLGEQVGHQPPDGDGELSVAEQPDGGRRSRPAACRATSRIAAGSISMPAARSCRTRCSSTARTTGRTTRAITAPTSTASCRPTRATGTKASEK